MAEKKSVPRDKLLLLGEVHLDLDGLYADFAGAVRRLTGLPPEAMEPEVMWAAIDADSYFFEDLELLPGSWKLWEVIRECEAVKFLTGKLETARFNNQKRVWVAKTFGSAYEVNIVPSEEKQKFAHEKAVLIDDDPDNISRWTAKGGVGIHHTGNYDETIDKFLDYVRSLKQQP